MKKLLLTTVALLVLNIGGGSTQENNNILFILDGSNSMWGQIEGEAKITSTQNVMGELLKDLPEGTDVGFITYGHRQEGSCEDIEVLAGVGEMSADELIGKISKLQPKGKTPIAGALTKSLDVLTNFQDGNNSVVLISDGLETCGGDPCAAAKALADAGIQTRVHVVGFDISQEESTQLQCIPAMGNGKYFSAGNAEELKLALAEVKEEAVSVSPPPQEPVVWFEDNFDGVDLADHWEVINPNPDAYIVEDGTLIVLTSGEKQLIGGEELENLFRLTKGIPDGDWTTTMRLIPEVATFREQYLMALYKDKDNMLLATAGNDVVCCDNAIVIGLLGDKVSNAQKTSFSVPVLRSPGIGNFNAAIQNYTDWTSANERAIVMRIEKSRRNYIISAKVEGDITMADGKEPKWVEIQKLTSMRPLGDSFVMALTQKPFNGNHDYQVNGGEALIAIDWIKIEVPEQVE